LFGYCHLNESSSNCLEGYYGPNCDQKCSCMNGQCSSNGTCLCFEGFIGDNCNQMCVNNGDDDCSIKCNCPDSGSCNTSNCIESLIIYRTSCLISSALILEGNTRVDESTMILSSMTLVVEKSMNVSNSTIVFQSSSILVDGCVNLSNTSITVNLENTSITNGDKILLFNSSSGCLNASTLQLSILNQENCASYSYETTSYSLTIFIHRQSCEEKPNINDWIVAVVLISAILCVAIFFIIFVYLHKPTRAIFFPTKKAREDMNKRIRKTT